MKTSSKEQFLISTAGWFVILLFGAALYRVVRVEWFPQSLPNFSPVLAIALCGALYLPLPRLAATITPILALAISDVLLNLHYGVPLISGYSLLTLGCYGLAAFAGIGLRRWKMNLAVVMGTTFLGSIVFYVVTNTASWFWNPGYAKTAFGWAQALTVGLPSYAPTWMFFRNSLMSDLLFALGFSIIAITVSKKHQTHKTCQVAV